MHKNRNSLVLTIALFAALLVFGISSPHKAYAGDATVNCGDSDATGDDSSGTEVGDTPCSNAADAQGNPWPDAQYPNYNGGDPPGAGTYFGGYGSGVNDSDFSNMYTNKVSNVVSMRQQAKHTFMSNIKTLDAKLQYCFDSLKAVFGVLNASSESSIVGKVLSLLLAGIVKALVGIVCGLIHSIVADFRTLLSAVNNLMCLPIPKLHLPRFTFPAFGAGHCSGISLMQFTTANPSTGNTHQKVLWHIWGKQEEQ